MRTRKTLFKGLLGIGFALVILLVFLMRGEGSRSNAWMENMGLKGERFTISELVQGRVIDTNDCMPAIESAAIVIGRSWARTTPNSYTDRKAAPTGQRRLAWEEMKLMGYDGRVVSWTEARRENEAMADALRKVHQAVAQPTREPGWDYSKITISGSVGNPIAKRTVVQTLGNAMLYELHQANLAGALDHLMAMVLMARVHEEGWNVINQMIRVAICGLAVDATWEALQAPGWTESDLQKLQHVWESHDLVPGLKGALEMDRALGLLHFDSFRRTKTGRSLAPGPTITNSLQLAFERVILLPAYDLAGFRADKLYYLKCMQSYIEGLREISHTKSWKFAKPAVEKQYADYMSRQTGLFGYRYSLTRQLMPNVVKAMNTMIKNQTLQQMTITAIAIKRYEMRHGQLPPDINVLVPEYLPNRPTDYWDGQSLRYRKNADGTFLLYACGDDLRDDGGNLRSDTVWEVPFHTAAQ
jgi:hypothetical protein